MCVAVSGSRRTAVVLAALLSAFVAACWGTIAAVGAFPADGATAREVAEQRLGDLGLALPRALAFLGSPPVAAAWTAALALVIARWLGRRYGALILAAAGVFLITTLIKVLADRPRPAGGAGLDPSFPSGHTAYVTAVLGLTAILLAERRRRGLAAGALLVVAAMGPSRVLLGVHWLSDVLAGYAIGAAWLALVVAYGLPWARRAAGQLRTPPEGGGASAPVSGPPG